MNNTPDDMHLNMEITFTPQHFMNYEMFVKKCVMDFKKELSFEEMLCVAYPKATGFTVFKIDGANFDKRVSDRYFYVSHFMLKAYDKTPSQFWIDWENCHKR